MMCCEPHNSTEFVVKSDLQASSSPLDMNQNSIPPGRADIQHIMTSIRTSNQLDVNRNLLCIPLTFGDKLVQ